MSCYIKFSESNLSDIYMFMQMKKLIILFPTVDPTVIIPYINKSDSFLTNKNNDNAAKDLITIALIVMNLKSSIP